MRVDSFDKLKHEAEAGTHVFVLDADIVWPGRVGDHGLRIRGERVVILGNGHTLDMRALSWPGAKTSGIELIGRDAVIEDASFSNFDGGKSGVKCYVGNSSSGWGGGTAGILDMRHVRFVNVGPEPRPFDCPEPAPDATHCWFSQPVGGRAPFAQFTDCVWENSARTNYWAHCVYLEKVLRAIMLRCWTTGSGDVLQTDGENVLLDNTFEVVAVPFRTSELAMPPLLSLIKPSVVWGNTFYWSGAVWHIRPVRTSGLIVAEQSSFRNNRWLGPMPDPWLAPGNGRWLTRDEWRDAFEPDMEVW